MMFNCPVCGRRRFTFWPEFWPWQYEKELFCSENCWICDATKKQMERKGFKMARMKKDGTPAKKPGRKPQVVVKKPEIPEPVSGGPWEKMETPEKTERSSFKAIVNPLDVFSLKSRVLRSGRFEIVGTDRNAMRLVYDPVKENEMLLKKASWEELIVEIMTALDQLGVLP